MSGTGRAPLQRSNTRQLWDQEHTAVDRERTAVMGPGSYGTPGTYGSYGTQGTYGSSETS
eukprot:scaffold14447_cov122-Isochrysis_galbana.AAC.3